jgi:UDP-galactopyranose mutase
VVSDYPVSDGDPYYPIPGPENEALFKRYAALVAVESNVYFAGRLAQYRYYNMD